MSSKVVTEEEVITFPRAAGFTYMDMDRSRLAGGRSKEPMRELSGTKWPAERFYLRLVAVLRFQLIDADLDVDDWLCRDTRNGC